MTESDFNPFFADVESDEGSTTDEVEVVNVEKLIGADPREADAPSEPTAEPSAETVPSVPLDDARAEPVAVEPDPEPVVAETEPIAVEPELASAPEADLSPDGPAVVEPVAVEPVAVEPDPEPVVAETEPAAAEPEPVVEAAAPVEPAPVSSESSPEPVATESDAPASSDNAASDAAVSDVEAAVEPGDDFASLGLRSEILSALAALGYDSPTPIQRETIPLLMSGQDLLGQAATGTGKTAAFALPIVHSIGKGAAAIPTALVLVPTRELAVQVSEAVAGYGRDLGIKVVAVYGGQPIGRQLGALDRGVHVVVATPGRALDHIKRRSLQLDQIKTVVLDEADEMLDMGFTEDIEAILEKTPDERQTVMFSATMPPRINSIAKRHQQNPVRIQIARADADAAKALIRQTVYMVHRNQKASALGRILDVENPHSAIVFCRTRSEVDELTQTMNVRGYRAEALHGGMDQNQRDRVMGRLREGTAELLVATDVAARGLDVDTLTHVVNYDVPTAPESYVHRIGRVGRAGREGVAITLAEPKQRRLLQNIERLTKQSFTMSKVPTVADLRARQIEITISSVREALAADNLDEYNSVLAALGDQADERTIALAAIKLIHEANTSAVDEVEIPDASQRGSKFDKNKRGNDRGGSDRGRPERGGNRSGRPTGRGNESRSGATASLYVGVGKKGGMRPGDLVGAIANEAGLEGREIGPIKISEHFSVVGVPEEAADRVIKAINNTSIRGKRAKVRRYTD